MKNLLIILFLIFSFQTYAYAQNIEDETVSRNVSVKIYSEDNYFGLKNSSDEVIVNPIYKKMIRLGDTGFIVQKRNRYGIIDNDGKILVPIKYSQAERLLGRFAKLGYGGKYALYDSAGKEILAREYSSIDLMFGGLVLTCKNFKYGISDLKGKQILENKFDDIYMPQPNMMRISFNGEWYEIEQVRGETLALPENIQNIKGDENFKISELIEKPATATGYSVVTFTDYLIKIFSSISPAHEKTIDELMLSKGAETVTILLKFTWLPKYPFVYARNYYNIIRTPNNGPLSNVKYELKSRLQ